MKLEDYIKAVENYCIKPPTSFEVAIKLFEKPNGREEYNQLIRDNVEDRKGVYIWVDAERDEIKYIGMAGKVKTDGSYGKHSLQKRLIASRGREIITKKDILTNDYIFNYMKIKNIKCLKFYIIYSKEKVPPTFLESLLLYKFYTTNDKLPELNNSF